MEASRVQQEIANAVSLLRHVFALKITDGFGIVDAPISSLIHAAAGGGRNKGFAERMALKIEAGITITSRRPTRSSGAPGQWLVFVPEIMVAELLLNSEWEFDDCGGTISCIPGAVCGVANIEYLSFVKKRETVAIPLAELFEHFPQLKPVDRSPVRIPALPAPLRTKLKPNQIAHVRRLRAGGFRAADLARMHETTVQDILEVTRTKLSKEERFRKIRDGEVLEPRKKRKPAPVKPKIPLSKQEKIRRMRNKGFRPDTLAKMFGFSVQEIDDVVAAGPATGKKANQQNG